jgi:4-diphosphocytidyl-2-C-methyl-D-erythritol kinase
VDDRALLLRIAAALGGDVPSQVAPGRTLMTGAGEDVRALAGPARFALVVLPSPYALSTPEVYRAFDAHATPRTPEELARLESQVDPLPGELVLNDLQDPARRLCRAIDGALDAVRATGAEHTLVSGSGPTVFGLYADEDRAREAARRAGGVVARPVEPAFAAVQG